MTEIGTVFSDSVLYNLEHFVSGIICVVLTGPEAILCGTQRSWRSVKMFYYDCGKLQSRTICSITATGVRNSVE